MLLDLCLGAGIEAYRTWIRLILVIAPDDTESRYTSSLLGTAQVLMLQLPSQLLIMSLVAQRVPGSESVPHWMWMAGSMSL